MGMESRMEFEEKISPPPKKKGCPNEHDCEIFVLVSVPATQIRHRRLKKLCLTHCFQTFCNDVQFGKSTDGRKSRKPTKLINQMNELIYAPGCR